MCHLKYLWALKNASKNKKERESMNIINGMIISWCVDIVDDNNFFGWMVIFIFFFLECIFESLCVYVCRCVIYIPIIATLHLKAFRNTNDTTSRWSKCNLFHIIWMKRREKKTHTQRVNEWKHLWKMRVNFCFFALDGTTWFFHSHHHHQ